MPAREPYIVNVLATDLYSEAEHEEIVEALEDCGASAEREGDGLRIIYSATGNVDAVAHTMSILREMEDAGLEAGALKIEAARDHAK